MRARLALPAAVLTAAVCAVACGSSGAADRVSLPPVRDLPTSSRSHVAVIVMENHEASEVLGSSQAPFFNKLATRYATPHNFFAIRHPSLPNYLALIGGSTFGITDDCTDCNVGGASLAGQLEHKRLTWKAYMQGIPHACYRGADSGDYAKRHNPFMYFDRIRTKSKRCHRIVRFHTLEGDLKKGRLPDFAWITPDVCHDTHDCSIRIGDRFLSNIVPALLHGIGPHGFVVVTYDEGESDAGCCSLAHGGRIATVIAGPDVRRGVTGPGTYTHYSTLRTIEDEFGLGHLGHAGDPGTAPLAPLFSRPPELARKRASGARR